VPKSRLLVSETSAEIHNADELEFIVIGEILQEEIPQLRREPNGMINPGIWSFEIKGDFNRVRDCFDGGKRIFRVVRGDGSTDSTDGIIPELRLPNGDVFEVVIRASGERISKPASLSSERTSN